MNFLIFVIVRLYIIILPAYDLVSQEDSLHLRVLDMVAALILHHLLGGGVDEPDVEVLLLSDT